MPLLSPKMGRRFRVLFADFGDQTEHLTNHVLRITRPHILMNDVYGVVGAVPLALDLRDDVMDITRTAVIGQLARQIKDDVTFSLMIETFDHDCVVREQWHLTQCRIIDCQPNELGSTDLMIRLLIDAKAISGNLGDHMVTLAG
jgi:hypothetical protein